VTTSPGDIEDVFLTVADVAELLKLNQQTVRNWIDQGSLPALRVGRRVRIRRSDLERMLEQGYTRAGRGGPGQKGLSAEGFWGGEAVGVAEPAVAGGPTEPGNVGEAVEPANGGASSGDGSAEPRGDQ
jgi:excisionase family DNA binding protein